jgi:hypothetical protein
MIPPKDSPRTLHALRPSRDEWYDRTARIAEMIKPPRSTRAAIPPKSRATSSIDSAKRHLTTPLLAEDLDCRTMRWKPRCEVAVSIACGMRAAVTLAVVRCTAASRPSSLFMGCLRKPAGEVRMRSQLDLRISRQLGVGLEQIARIGCAHCFCSGVHVQLDVDAFHV